MKMKNVLFSLALPALALPLCLTGCGGSDNGNANVPDPSKMFMGRACVETTSVGIDGGGTVPGVNFSVLDSDDKLIMSEQPDPALKGRGIVSVPLQKTGRYTVRYTLPSDYGIANDSDPSGDESFGYQVSADGHYAQRSITISNLSPSKVDCSSLDLDNEKPYVIWMVQGDVATKIPGDPKHHYVQPTYKLKSHSVSMTGTPKITGDVISLNR